MARILSKQPQHSEGPGPNIYMLKTRWDNPDRFYDDGGEASLQAFERQWDKEQALAEWEALLQAVGHQGLG